jgi:5-aminopentanamidase
MKRCVETASADLFVFPEMFLTGYMIRDEVFRLAEGMDGRSVSTVQKLAEEQGTNILFGMATWDCEVPGVMHNSAVLVSPDKDVQRYEKVNLATFGPFEEGLYFSAGRSRSTMEVKGHRIGVMICYDLFFPQLSMDYALDGAEAIICISASPFTSREYFERLLPARAIETTSYVAYQNQVGTQLNEVFFGGGEARGPKGDLLAKNKYFEEDLNTFDLSREVVVAARRGRPTVRDGLSRC